MSILDGSETDGELYKLAVHGNRDAVEMLVGRHSSNIAAYLRSKTDSSSVVEDAVAETWLKFFRHLLEAADNPNRELRKPESIRFWLLRTALNTMRSEFRTQARERDLEARASIEATALGLTAIDPTVVLHEESDQVERRSALRIAFSRLSEACRELLTLLSADPPLSYQEVAEIVERPVGSLGPTRRRCLEQLRFQMGLVQ